MDVRDSLALIELDKGAETFGPLFETPARRLQEEPRFRADWAQYQGLRALAWEAAPELDERLLRQALQASRRQEVERKLARATGSQDAARELLLEARHHPRTGLPVWAAFLLLAGALGLGWLAFKPSPSPQAAAALPAAKAQEPLAFEFPVSAPPQSTLDGSQAAPHDETHSDDASTRQARRLVNQTLREAAAAKPAPRARPAGRPQATRQPTPTVLPTRAPTAVPTAVPAAVSVPAAPETSIDAAAKPEASFSLSGPQFPVSATLALPQSGNVDLRLFDMRGRLVHRYADATHAAGTWRMDLPATDEQGRALPKGSYYLRVITRWFSKVEALEQP